MPGIISRIRSDMARMPVMLPATVLSAIPAALLQGVRPWMVLSPSVSLLSLSSAPTLGQWCVVVVVAVTVVDMVRGIIADLRHGHAGVDVLAVMAILSTLFVGEFWASWAVCLMVWSGEAIEDYARGRAGGDLSALMDAAPREAHLVALSGVGRRADAGAGIRERGTTSSGFRSVTSGESSRMAASDSSQRPSSPRRADGLPLRTVDAADVRVGDVLAVLPGETVPVDGELLSGTATLDLSSINGEPLPREVFAGARVPSGAVNGSAALTMRAVQVAADSQYQRILRLVSSAQESRPPAVRTADRLAVPFTLLSLAIAAGAWIATGAPSRFAQVLVLATPCPLLIAAPVAFVAGTGRLAKAGVLIRSQDVLETLAEVTHVFFDKTGTLTVKTPQVVAVDVIGGLGRAAVWADREWRASTPGTGTTAGASGFDDSRRILALAGVLETYSVHILAKGIARAGSEALAGLRAATGRPYPVVTAVSEDPGNGIEGDVDGVHMRVGRLAFVVPRGDADRDAARAACEGLRPLAPDEMLSYVSCDGRLSARIVLRDVPRADSRASLDRLRGMGVTGLTMVTGDRLASAKVIADEVGIADVRADLLPEDKLRAVRDAGSGDSSEKERPGRRNRRRVTMMVGDGVNDAPVLAAADVGMAMTDGTATAASESAQAVIMTDDISAVPGSLAIARRTRRIMLQAVVGGLVLAVVGMTAAAFDLIPVVAGAFLQEGIDVASILWALTALIGSRDDSSGAAANGGGRDAGHGALSSAQSVR